MAKKTGKSLYAGRGQAADADRSRLGWWKDARYGLFIHWGLYAIPAGFWNGKSVQGLGEWIMFNGKIPVNEYEQLASKFNPVHFDAPSLVATAQALGMRYLVITAKHHDGFAMFQSPSNKYNVADATPCGRDIIGELAAACHDASLPIGFYYSQDQDWHDPDGAWNDWDYNESDKDFEKYFRRKVVPQVTELLTQYGPVGLIWFDTPYTMAAEYSRELRELVHHLQPDCLVSGRVGNDLGDYGSLGDNQIPVGPIDGDYETPATLNDTWGFRSDDDNWKTGERLLYLLIDLASKGINYLLNIGPEADGTIPGESIKRLETVGTWLETNGEAIYGKEASPFPWEFDWGRITVGDQKMYLIFFEWPSDQFELVGLRNTVLSVATLSGSPLEFRQKRNDHVDLDEIMLSGFDRIDSQQNQVVVLELEGQLSVDERLLQQPDGSVRIPAFTGTFFDVAQISREITARVSAAGFTDEWHDTNYAMRFRFFIRTSGDYEVVVQSAAPVRHETGVDMPELEVVVPHRVKIEIATDKSESFTAVDGELRADELLDTPRAQYFPEMTSNIGSVHIPHPGEYIATLRALSIADSRELQVSAIVLKLQQ